jgi:hypothetical protein
MWNHIGLSLLSIGKVAKVSSATVVSDSAVLACAP